MKFSPKKVPYQPTLNLTPLIDIVFLLLIFFMVTTSFVDRGQLELQLPTADKSAPLMQHQLYIRINSFGQYQVNNLERKVTGRAALMEELKVAFEDKHSAATIEADSRTQHQVVITAFDALGEMGISKISLVTVSE